MLVAHDTTCDILFLSPSSVPSPTRDEGWKPLLPERAERIGAEEATEGRNHGKDDLASSRKVLPFTHWHV